MLKVDFFMYVVLSKAENHMPHWELVGTTECIMLWMRCHTNWGRYNRVKQYIWAWRIFQTRIVEKNETWLMSIDLICTNVCTCIYEYNITYAVTLVTLFAVTLVTLFCKQCYKCNCICNIIFIYTSAYVGTN